MLTLSSIDAMASPSPFQRSANTLLSPIVLCQGSLPPAPLYPPAGQTSPSKRPPTCSMVPGRALVAPLSLLSILSVVSPGPVRCFQGQPSAGLLSRRTRPASSCASRAGYSSGGGARASGFARSGYVRGGTSTRWFTCTGASIGDAAGDSGRRQLELHTGATLKDAMREAIAFLESAGIEPGEADAGADILLGEITGLSRSAIRSAGSTRVLSDGELEQFRAMILRRGTREPVQYILGEWPFYNLERLKIRPPTLIPRPETEELVEMVLRDAAAAPARFLEVGPGSGAISLALLREWPNTRATAVDLCAHAVELSRENGVLTGLSDRITVEHAGISAWAPPPSLVQAPFDLLVSNPPYIPHAQMATLDPEVRVPASEFSWVTAETLHALHRRFRLGGICQRSPVRRQHVRTTLLRGI